MEAFLIYIAKVSIAAGVFYLAYLLLFQKQKHFNFNRIYLPVSMLLSFVIPVITFTTINYVELVTQESNLPTISYFPSSPDAYVAPTFEFEWYHYLFGFYILGVAGFLLHLFIGHLKAMHIIRTSKAQQLFNYLINITGKDVHPFSFFNKIVLSERMLSNPDLEMIVNHEKIHVREKHTFDILLAEMMFVIQWFNPFAWFIKSAVRNNLEFKTDDEITKTYDPQKYQLAMVALADKKEIAPFLTALNGSQLKNRIMMMKQKTENRFRLARQLVVLPLLAILVMGLSNKEVKTEYIETDSKVEINYVSPKEYSIADIEISGNSNLEKSKLLQISGLKIGQEIEMPGNETRSAIEKLWDQGLFSDVKILASRIVDDNIWLNIYLEEKQNLQDNFIKDNQSSKEEPSRGATSPDHRLPTETEWEDAVSKKGRIIIGKITDKDGNPIAQANVIQYDKPGGSIVVGAVTDSIGAFIIKLTSDYETLNISKIGYELKEVNVAGKEEVNFVLKEKIKDKNSLSGQKKPGDVNSLDNFKNPLFILVDGVQFTPNKVDGFDWETANLKEFGELINVAPENIESIEFLNDAASIAVYGEKAKNGVLRIKTKKKEGVINSIHELRSFLTREIIFPEEARNDINDQLNMRFFVRVNDKGEITDVGENIAGDDEIFSVDEIIVTAIRPKNVVKESDIKNDNLMAKEAERALNKIPDIEIPELKGKILEFRFKFVLSDYPNRERNTNYIDVPSGFSPNGDGVHDVFEVDGLAKKYPNFSMKIINKTGDIVWEYQHNGNPNKTPQWWNGKVGSVKAETGTYAYLINYNDGSSTIQNGYLHLAK